MLVVQEFKPPERKKSRDASYTSKEIASYLEIASKQLAKDIRAIERAEKESWVKVRNYKIP